MDVVNLQMYLRMLSFSLILLTYILAFTSSIQDTAAS